MGRNRPVVLVGPMAVGKSAVGRSLAQRTGARFVDSDRVVAERHGSIPAIFAQQGEPAFRILEAEVVREALALDDVVVSLGGGAVLHPGTQGLLGGATVIFLDTDVETILPRIRGDSGRPLLAERPAERWQELYDERRPLYARLASVIVDTRGLTVREATDAVLRALPERDHAPGTASGPVPDQEPPRRKRYESHGD
ncbi:shikimate kinase [Arthrobacter sp. NPDC092385]|uniref:shikimate kinase n=1 Tax=Arthrobacter sp. NPDC092385 TaxID=3363943 RepID=UPI003827CFB0